MQEMNPAEIHWVVRLAGGFVLLQTGREQIGKYSDRQNEHLPPWSVCVILETE